MPNNLKKHQHFKMTDDNVHHLLNHPGKLAFFVAVFLTVLICAALIACWQKTNIKDFPQIFQKKELPKNQEELKSAYQSIATQTISNYWQQRGQLIKNKELCLKTLNETASNLLNLIVTKEFKELQLKLIILLDNDKNTCQANKSSWPSETTASWQKILNQYPWLIKSAP